MRALLLAAGLGTRLKPLTNFLPKCLVPIHGRPLLDYWLELLVSSGVTEILINTHYLSPMVVEFVSECSWKEYLTIVYEETLLGTGGTILMNRAFFKNEPFIVAHADNLTIFDVKKFIDSHKHRQPETVMTMMVFETDDPQSCGIVDVDNQGVVKNFYEKVPNPPGNQANAAVYIFESNIIEYLEKLGNIEIDLSTEVIPHLIGRISTYFNFLYHRDIGNLTSWTEANKDFPVNHANQHNALVWSKILNKNNGILSKSVSQLLSETIS